MTTITDYIERRLFSSEAVQKRYIITGGPGVGKTSLIKYLEGQGEAVIHEAATDIIKSEIDKGVSEPWSKVGFREKVIALQEQRQLQAAAKKVDRVFCDRSPIDTLTFCLVLQAEPTIELKRAVQKIIDEGFYQRVVFLIENLGFCEQNEVRCENQEASLIIHEKLKENYKSLGFDVISIPACSVEERVNMIYSYSLIQKT